MEDVLARIPTPLRRLAAPLLAGGREHARSGLSAMLAFVIRSVSAGILVAVQILLARWLGTAEFGIYATAGVWVTVIGTLATLGLASSAVRFLPAFRERGEFGDFRGFLRIGHLTALGVGTALSLAGLTALWLNPGLIAPYYLIPLGIALLSVPAYAMGDFQDGAGRAQGWIAVALAPPYILRPLLILLFAGVAALAGLAPDAGTAMMAAAAAVWLAALTQYAWLKWRLAEALPVARKAYGTRRWIAASLPFLLLEGLQLAMLNLDVLALNLFAPPEEIGVYFAAGRIISLIGFIHFAVVAVAMPRFAALEAQGRRAEILPYLHVMQKWTFLPSAAGAAILIALGKPVLTLFGSDFTRAHPLMYVLALGLLLRAFAGPAQSLLMASGHQGWANGIVAAAVTMAGLLYLTLIPWIGPMGAAIGMATALGIEAFGTLIAVHYLYRRTHAAHPPR